MKIGAGAIYWINRKREIVLDRIVNSQRKPRGQFSLMQKETSSCKREEEQRRLDSK